MLKLRTYITAKISSISTAIIFNGRYPSPWSSDTYLIALFTDNILHLYHNEIKHECEVISGKTDKIARNCLVSMLNCIVMQFSKVISEKGYWKNFVGWYVKTINDATLWDSGKTALVSLKLGFVFWFSLHRTLQSIALHLVLSRVIKACTFCTC